VPKSLQWHELTKGLGWVWAQSWGIQVVRLVTLTILAAILLPEEFGIFAFAAAVISILTPLAGLGLSAAVVFDEEMDAAKFCGSVGLAFSAGLLAMLLLLICVQWVPAIAGLDEAWKVLLVVSPALPLAVLANSALAIHRRNKRFGLLAQVTLSAELAGSLVAIALAFAGAGVASLVARLLITQALLALSSLWFMRELARWPDMRAAIALARRGLPVAASQMLTMLRERADELLVGAFFGPAILGFYSLARRFTSALRQAIPAVLNNHAWPIYASLRDEPTRLRAQITHTLQLSIALTWPALALLALTSPMWIGLLLGSEWLPAVPILYVLCTIEALRAALGPFASILISLGFARQRLWLDIMLAVVNLAVIALLAPLGLQYVLVGLVTVNCAIAPLEVAVARQYVASEAWPKIGSQVPALLAVLGLCGALYLLDLYRPGGVVSGLALAAILSLGLAALLSRTLWRGGRA